MQAPLARIAAITGLAALGLIGFWTLQDSEPAPPAEPGVESVAGPRTADPGKEPASTPPAAAGTDSQPLRLQAAEGGPAVSSSLPATDAARPGDEPTAARPLDDPTAVAPPLSQALLDSQQTATGPEADPHLATSSGAHRGRSARHSRLHGVAKSK